MFNCEGYSQPFPSSDLAGLQNVDYFGVLPATGSSRAAAELAQDAPRFELGIVGLSVKVM